MGIRPLVLNTNNTQRRRRRRSNNFVTISTVISEERPVMGFQLNRHSPVYLSHHVIMARVNTGNFITKIFNLKRKTVKKKINNESTNQTNINNHRLKRRKKK